MAEWFVQFSQRGMTEVAKSGDKAERKLRESGVQADRLKQKLSGLVSPTRMLGTALAGLGVGLGIRESLKLFARQEDAEVRLEAVTRATGQAAGFTSEQLKEMAADLQKVTRFGDEATMEAQAMLLTFRSIKGDVFESLLELAMDLASTFKNISLESATMQLGKAFEDPARQMSQLRRSGISFSKQQEENIKRLQEQGQMAQAQMMMLGVIQAQVGGTARAMAESTAGRWTQVTNEIGDSLETIGKGIATTLGDIVLPLLKGTTRVIAMLGKAMESKAVRVFLKFTTVLIGAGGTVWAVTKVIAMVKALMVAIQGLATAQTILTALSGPKGWLALAAGAAVATAGVAALASEFRKLKDDADDAMKAAGKPIPVGGGLPGGAGAGGVATTPAAQVLQTATQAGGDLRQRLQSESRVMAADFSDRFAVTIGGMTKSVREFEHGVELARKMAKLTLESAIAERIPSGLQGEARIVAGRQLGERKAEAQRQYEQTLRKIQATEVAVRLARFQAERQYADELESSALALKQQQEESERIRSGLAAMGRSLKPLTEIWAGMQKPLQELQKQQIERRKQIGEQVARHLPMALGALLAGPGFAASLGIPTAMRAAGKGAGAFAGTYGPKEPPRRAFSISSLAGLTDTMQAQAGQQVQQRQLETQQGMLAKLGEMIGHFKRMAQQTRTGPAFWGETAIGR